MSSVAIEFIHTSGTWRWENGPRVLEASDAKMTAGEVRAIVTVTQEGALVHRSGVKLTTDRERDRFLHKVEAAGTELPSGILLALEQRIREDGVPDTDGREDGSGSRITISDPEPWPEPLDGAALLDDLVRTFCRYLALPDGAPEALVLWTLHAHAHDAADVSPLLALTSPEKRCGKTTTLHVLASLVPRPLPASSVTAAALFRAVEQFRPTLLVDEADTFLRDRDDLRGVLNSGHLRASAVVVRTVRDEHEARLFSTWAPKAVALIGTLPDTLADRSIILSMRRQQPEEPVERLRLDKLGELESLRRKAWRWASDNAEELRDADPEIPSSLHDRARDNWRPLLAIADLAGGEWPKRARDAALVLHGGEREDGSVRTLLLLDLRDLFETRREERLSSEEIVDALALMEERPWPEWGRQKKPLTTRALAVLLGPFGVEPKQLKFGGKKHRGYELKDLEEPFSRYLNPSRRFSIRYPGTSQ